MGGSPIADRRSADTVYRSMVIESITTLGVRQGRVPQKRRATSRHGLCRAGREIMMFLVGARDVLLVRQMGVLEAGRSACSRFVPDDKLP